MGRHNYLEEPQHVGRALEDPDIRRGECQLARSQLEVQVRPPAVQMQGRQGGAHSFTEGPKLRYIVGRGERVRPPPGKDVLPVHDDHSPSPALRNSTARRMTSGFRSRARWPNPVVV